MYYVYILYSEKLTRYYVGTTDNVEQRLEEHNSKFFKDSYTSKGIPWTLKWKTELINSNSAYSLERFIKSMKSKKFIEKLMISPELLKDLLQKLN